MPNTDAIEAKLLEESAEKSPRKKREQKAQDALDKLEFDIILADSDAGSIFFDADGNLDSAEEEVTPLEGAEALKFLGLPANRPHNILKRGDWKAMKRKFANLEREYLMDGIDHDERIWKNVLIRVWKKANVGQKTAKGATSKIESYKYNGDIFDGRAISGFLSEVRNSITHNDFVVQLLKVNATEDMKRYA